MPDKIELTVSPSFIKEVADFLKGNIGRIAPDELYISATLNGADVRISIKEIAGNFWVFITPEKCYNEEGKRDDKGLLKPYNQRFQHVRRKRSSLAVYSAEEMVALIESDSYEIS